MKLPLVTIPPLEMPAVATESLPYVRYNPGAESALVLACDHASAAIPAQYDQLGVTDVDLARHIALDIGAARLTEALATRLDCPAVMAAFSRLLIDPNRARNSPGLIPEVSDGITIPGNLGLDKTERDRRIANFHESYHQAVADAMMQCSERGHIPAFVGMHSFTPEMDGAPRPWEVGILWNQDDRLAHYIIDWFRAKTDFEVGENEPYSGRVAGYSMDRHGGRHGFPNVVIEIRQDLIADVEGVKDWTEIIARLLGDMVDALSPFERTTISVLEDI